MAEIETKKYNLLGKESGKIQLPEELFGAKWNADLVHQVLVSMESNARSGTAHSKDRSEARGGGRKPWRQKGTGSARHGSRRSPIWVGGGVTFGPRKERNYEKKINKKMRIKTLLVGLSQKLRDEQIVFVEDIGVKEISTKKLKEVLSKLSKIKGFETINTPKSNNILLVSCGHNEIIKKSAKNISHVSAIEAEKLNIVDLAKYRYIVISNPDDFVEVLGAKIKKK